MTRSTNSHTVRRNHPHRTVVLAETNDYNDENMEQPKEQG